MMSPTNPISAACDRSSDPDAAWIDNRVAQRLFGAGHRKIGRYRVLGVLGSGGTGLVYLATDDQLQRQVALKLLDARSYPPGGAERLLREARAMALLSHPAVVQVHEAGVHDGHIFIVTEFVVGGTPTEWPITPGRPWRAVRDDFVTIARGICAAHAVGIVHRGLKPSNILVDQQGRPKVADFGLTRTEQEGSTEPMLDAQPPPAGPLAPELTMSGVAVGTPRYMAPEQQHTQITSFASDQYSFCLLMWEMLYQRHPFEAPDAETMLAAKLAGKVDPCPRHTSVPTRIHRALLRGLQAAPSARWPTMIALLDQLERDPWPRRHPWLTVLAAALVAPAIFTAQLLSREPPGKSCTADAHPELCAPSATWVAGPGRVYFLHVETSPAADIGPPSCAQSAAVFGSPCSSTSKVVGESWVRASGPPGGRFRGAGTGGKASLGAAGAGTGAPLARARMRATQAAISGVRGIGIKRRARRLSPGLRSRSARGAV